jgi:hypothetical protein
MEPIKKLPKEILSEGLTLEAVNSRLFEQQCSPAILRAGEETVNLICINDRETPRRYWVRDSSGNNVKDGGKLLVIKEKEARIGRARYLLLYGEQEERERRERFFSLVDAKAEEWKKEVNREMKKLYFDLQVNKCLAGAEYENVSNALFPVDGYIELRRQNGRELSANPRWKEQEAAYNKLDALQKKGDYFPLMKLFGKVKSGFGSPIFTADLNSEIEIHRLMRIFGSEALEHWNGDMIKIYAAIELSKKL